MKKAVSAGFEVFAAGWLVELVMAVLNCFVVADLKGFRLTLASSHTLQLETDLEQVVVHLLL